LRLQDKTAQAMKSLRRMHGALSLQTIESKPIFDGDQIGGLQVEEKNRAKELIEDFMIAANGVTARYLAAKRFPSIRRVVRTPARWDRIVQLAAEHAYALPADPDPKALEGFLAKESAADPQGFPDLSLCVIKLLGSGEYVAELPGATAPGHFGLAVSDYTHSTAPNRRYPDLITGRLLKAAMRGRAVPYAGADLEALAKHCTEEEDIVKKVERQVQKSAGALFLQSRIGERFDAVVTGAAAKGTWVRLLALPVEGKLVQGFQGMDVGHRVAVQLVSVDVMRGFIDFRRARR
jgi:exoribonuclease R